MKRYCISVLVLLLLVSHISAQVTAKPLRNVATLDMPGELGKNGACVAWHPGLKKFYVSFAGNAAFPFAVFNATGMRLSPAELEAMADVRGIWYNTVSKKIEANGFSKDGWVRYILGATGIPENVEQIQEGQVQPEENSVGVFDAVKKNICFLSDGRIVFYSLQGKATGEEIVIKNLNKTELAEGELEDVSAPTDKYNTTALCYTGITNAEFAILNYGDLQIELYNRKGVLTRAFKLPEGVAVYSNFNFAYANSTWWLFDKEERKWFGFK